MYPPLMGKKTSETELFSVTLQIVRWKIHSVIRKFEYIII